MTKADGTAATPAGDLIATLALDSKEHQLVLPADASGHIVGSRPVYVVDIPLQVHVASANTVHWDLFNADGSAIVRVQSIRHIPGIITAVTGVAFAWLLERTTAVGTGGSALTAVLPDTSQASLSANITARSKPTGGATQSTDLRNYTIHGEETNAGSMVSAAMGGVELIWPPLIPPWSERGILLRQNQGLRCVQVTNSAAGWSGWSIAFTVE